MSEIQNTYEVCVDLYGPTGGSAGPRGHQGFIGSAGVNGVQGPQGVQGFIGNVGSLGPQGPVGIGQQGPQGRQGIQGTLGAVGPQGRQGVQGTIFSPLIVRSLLFTEAVNTTVETNLFSNNFDTTATGTYRITAWGRAQNVTSAVNDTIRLYSNGVLHNQINLQDFVSIGFCDWFLDYIRYQEGTTTDVVCSGTFSLSNTVVSPTSVNAFKQSTSNAYSIPFFHDITGASGASGERMTIQMGNANASHSWSRFALIVQQLSA